MIVARSSVEGRARLHAALGDPARLTIVDMLAVADASPGEISRVLHLPTNLVAHHVNTLQSAGLLTRVRSEGDRRRVYLRLAPTALAVLLSPPASRASRVVFVCTHNSARSRLAAALLARRNHIPATSAGTNPAERVHPRALSVARWHGLNLDRARTSQFFDVARRDDLVIAVCDNAHESLPADQPRLHWSVPDPARVDTDDAFEAVYTELAERIDRLTPTPVPRADHG
jgi:protein-tyrosine-phosphatase